MRLGTLGLRSTIGLAVFAMAGTHVAWAQTDAIPSQTLTPPADRYLEAVEFGRRLAREIIAEDNLPGISIAVGIGGEIVWAEGFGWANKTDSVPITPLTRFPTGSASKPVTTRDLLGHVAGRATGYQPSTNRSTRLGIELAPTRDQSCILPAGGFMSTPSDLVRFGLSMVDNRLLEPETLGMLRTEQTLESGEPTEYGLGWFVHRVPFQQGGTPTLVIGHGGSSVGGSTAFMTLPEHGIVVSATSNVHSARRLSLLAHRVVVAFIGVDGNYVTDAPEHAPNLMQTMNLLFGDGLVPWELVLDDGLLTAVFGGTVAGGSLKLAQLADALPPGSSQDRIDRSEGVDRLASARERDTR